MDYFDVFGTMWVAWLVAATLSIIYWVWMFVFLRRTAEATTLSLAVLHEIRNALEARTSHRGETSQ